MVGQAAFDNPHQSETKAVYALLERLQLSGVTVSLDALHAQKKPSRCCKPKAMTM
ncbi:hypothetical protein ACKFKH_07015 [Phormidesmis sp. 146-20]